MANALEILKTKIETAAPTVEKKDVADAQAAYRAMTDAEKQANRETLLGLRYLVDTSKMEAAAKADLAALQAELPARTMVEAGQHVGGQGVEAAKDLGGKSLDVAKEMGGELLEGGKDITDKVMTGDVKGALTHPVSAGILGALGLTVLSRWVLNTTAENKKTSFWSDLGRNVLKFAGIAFIARVIQKYSA